MKIPNYDCGQDETNYQQLHDFMPHDNFRMLICGPSGCGKTNTLMYKTYYDKIYLYAKNLEQAKNQKLIQQFEDISEECG